MRKVSTQSFKEQADSFIEECSKDKRTPFMHEFAFRIGISEDTLTAYGKISGYADTVKRIRLAGKTAITRSLDSDSKANINKMFLAKAVFGLIEKQGLEVSGNLNLGVVMLPPKSVQKPNK